MLMLGRKERHAQIKAAMALRHITGTQVAKETGFSNGHVAQVIQCRRYSSKVVDALISHGIPGYLFMIEEVGDDGRLLPGEGNRGGNRGFRENDTQKAEGF